MLTTHIDKGHIHSHMIFNNVNFVTGKCYQSNKRSYHTIRRESDNLCKDYKLSVLDEHYEAFKNKYKTKGKGYYEYQHHRKGASWKSKFQFTIDNVITRSKTWEDFLRKMEQTGYEIKCGEHIAFKHKDKQRFMRTKTIEENYTEEALKDRLKNKRYTVVDNLVKVSKNKGKGYEIWAKKHNLKTISSNIYDYYRDNSSDSLFKNEYQAEFVQYKMTVKELKENNFKISDSENILAQLNRVHEKKSSLLQDYSSLNDLISTLRKLRINFSQFMKKDVER